MPSYIGLGLKIVSRLVQKIAEYTKYYFPAIDVNISRDSSEIYSQYIEGKKQNSLSEKEPELSKEWHPTKNGYLKPDMISFSSGKKVWWLGKCGHEWQASADNRRHGNGCPICAGYQILVGYNDLATVFPKLANEWCLERNEGLLPTQVTRGSRKKVWWVCSEGHEYEATISNRSYGKGCPICAGKKIVQGINDLATMNPKLASEWSYQRNQELMPVQVSPNSHKKVWWICDQGHEWEAQIKSRNMGTGCPICAKTKGYKDKKNNI